MESVLWLGLAAVLLLLELAGADLFELMVPGVAGLALAALTALAPDAPRLLQLLMFAALVIAGGCSLALWRRRELRRLRPQAEAEAAEVIRRFNRRGRGLVRWQGQSWAARNLQPGQRLAPGSAVAVVGREGGRLQVLPQEPPAG